MRKTGRERKLDAPLLKRKVFDWASNPVEIFMLLCFFYVFVLTSFKSLLGFVRVFTDSQEIQPM